jgi:hypothetical protein
VEWDGEKLVLVMVERTNMDRAIAKHLLQMNPRANMGM